VRRVEELLRREEQEWLPRHVRAENWAAVACSLSTLKAFETGISAKDVKEQFHFLVQTLERAAEPNSSESACLTPSRRPFSFAENVALLAWAVRLDNLPPNFPKSNTEPTGHLNLWKASINVAKVADILTASPLCHERDRIPVREVAEALDIIGRVLQPTVAEHLVTTPGGTDSTRKPD